MSAHSCLQVDISVPNVTTSGTATSTNGTFNGTTTGTTTGITTGITIGFTNGITIRASFFTSNGITSQVTKP